MSKLASLLLAVTLVGLTTAVPIYKPRVDPLTVGIFYDVFDEATTTLLKAQYQDGVWDLMLPDKTDLTIEFNPFATGKVDGDAVTCTGDNDCLGTKLHACAIKLHTDTVVTNHQIFHYVVCTATHPNWSYDPAGATNECINQVAEWPDEAMTLEECAKNATQVNDYLADFQAKSSEAGVSKVPWVTIGGQQSDDAATDLKAAVCGAWTGEAPAECSADGTDSPGDALEVDIYYNVFDEPTNTLLKAQAQGQNGVWDLMAPNKKDLVIYFNPVGTATVEGETVTCVDDPDCHATKLQLCAIKEHEGSVLTNHQIFHFIVCTASHDNWKTNPDDVVNQCILEVNEWPDDFIDIEMCSRNDTQTGQWLAEYAALSQEAGVNKVPWVEIGGEYNEAAATDLKAAICDSFPGAKPDECSASAGVNVGIFYDVFDNQSLSLIGAQYNDGVWDMMLPDKTDLVINFNPFGTGRADGDSVTCSGDPDCVATKLHACAIKLHEGTVLTNHQIFHFVVCTATHDNWKTDPTTAVSECINEVAEWPDEGMTLEECAKNATQVNGYLADFAAKVTQNGVTRVPTVTINGEHNEVAINDLKGAVCEAFPENGKPAECSSSTETPSTPGTGDALDVSIYYNVFDDPTITLLKAQYQDGVWDMMLPDKSDLVIYFNPLGTATVDGDTVTCVDDPDCHATKLQLCAIKEHEGSVLTNHQIFHFIICTATHDNWKTDPDAAVNQCVNEVDEWPDDFIDIEMCSKDTNLTSQYLAEYAALAQKAGVTKVPWVTIAGEYNEAAATDLKAAICDAFPGEKPSECGASTSPPGNALEVDIYYNVFDDPTITLLKAQNQSGIWDMMLPEKTDLVVYFNPVGTATVDGDTVTCVDDPDCHATKLQLCAIKEHEGTVLTNHQIFHFIVCTASHDNWKTNPDDVVNQCILEVNEWPDDFIDIEMCSRNDTQTAQWLAEYAALSQEAGVNKVPWVTIGGQYNEGAATDLKGAICDAFPGEKPSECGASTSPPGNALEVDIYYNVFDDPTITLLKGQYQSGIWDMMLPEKTDLVVYFNPVGTATVNGDTVTCVDDPDCHATKLQLCAIKSHEGSVLTNHQIFHFIICTATHDNWKTDPDEAVNQCINEVDEWPDDFIDIEMCSKDANLTSQYLAEYAALAQQAGVNKVPWVEIAGEYNEAAASDLKAAICDAFPGEKPSECGASTGSTTSPGSSTGSPGDALEVDIYYNVFDDLTITLLKGQNQSGIWDMMLPEKTDLVVYFNPVGTATVDGETVTCVDDPDCHATKLQLCAIKEHEGSVLTNHQIFHFIVCTASHDNWKTNPDDVVNQCILEVNEWPDDFIDIEMCSKNDTLTAQYLAEYAALSQTAGVNKVPWVTIGGQYNEGAATDLKGAICDAFPGEKPSECGASTSPPGNALEVDIYYNVFDDPTITLLKAQYQDGVWDMMLPEKTDLVVYFNPVGTATVDGETVTCVDDPDCHATKLQLCAIKEHEGSVLTNHQIFHFIICTATHDNWKTDPDAAVNQCINEVDEWPDDFIDIEMCSKDPNVTAQYLAEYAALAQQAGVNKVPWVEIAGEYNEAAASDLKAAICDAFPGEKPSECGASTGSTTSPGSSTGSPDNALDIDIYYNVFDEPTITLLKSQYNDGIWDMMAPDKTDLVVYFNPVGTATVSARAVACVDDPDCHATKLQLCAIKEHEGTVLTNHQIFHFIVCTATHDNWKTNPDDVVNQCILEVNEWPDDFIDIEMCSKNDTLTAEYLAEYAALAQAAGVNKVPWVAIEGEYNEAASSDLMGAVCDSFPGEKPAECSASTTPGSSTASTSSESGSTASTSSPDTTSSSSIGSSPGSTGSPSDALEVDIYYNVFDDPTITLLKGQAQDQTGIWDLMLPEKTDLVVYFNPLGTATVDGDTVTCVGDPDCHATKLQLCAIKEHEGSVLTNHQIFHFIVCTATHDNWKTDPDDAVNQCINQVDEWPDDFVDIEMCSKDAELTAKYLSEYAGLAQQAGVTKVPWITIDGQQSEEAVNDLKAAVCAAFPENDRPAECSTSGTGGPGTSPGSSSGSSSGTSPGTTPTTTTTASPLPTSDPGDAGQMVSSSLMTLISLLVLMLFKY